MRTFGLCLMIIIYSNYAFSEQTLTDKINQKKADSAAKMPPEVQQVFQKATLELKKSGIEQKALTKGKMVPRFKVGKKDISKYYQNGLTLIKFYRGGWCPYCMLELQEYEKFYSEFKKSGVEIVALAPDLKKEISLTKKKFKLTFPIFPDKDNHIAKKFGLVFKVDKDVQKIYKKFGIDLDHSQGNKKRELPMPGTYLVNKSGEIIYAFLDADYTIRADPRDILTFVTSLKKE